MLSRTSPDPLAAWNVEGTLSMLHGEGRQKRPVSRFVSKFGQLLTPRYEKKAKSRTRYQVFPKLAEVVDGQHRIKDEPPLIYHYDHLHPNVDDLQTDEWYALVIPICCLSRYFQMGKAHQ